MPPLCGLVQTEWSDGGGGGEWAIPAMYGQVEEGERLLVEAIVEASNQ